MPPRVVRWRVSSIEKLEERLRQFPDDWAEWMVYADWLSERGDIRGELLAIENKLWAKDEPPRDAPEVEQSLWYADEIACEWLASHEDALDEDDVEDVDRFLELGRALLPLPTTPAAVRRLLSKRSHVLATLRPVEVDTPVPPSSLSLMALHDKLIESIIGWLSAAFDGVPVPDPGHRTIHQAEAADNYDSCDRSRDHTGRWQDLPDEHLLTNQWSLAHLDEQGIHYYYPALMCFTLRHLRGHHPDDNWITESHSYGLAPSGADLRDYQLGRFELFERHQRAAIYAFTIAAGYEASDAWARVAVAEKHEEAPAWFEIYSPDA